jgi:hypothetical protein
MDLTTTFTQPHRLAVSTLILVKVAAGAAPVELPSIRLAAKPADHAVERRPRAQPTVPDGAQEVPFLETAAKGSHTIAAVLEGAGGVACAEASQDLASPPWMPLSLPRLESGAYTLRLTIDDGAGRECSELVQPIRAHAGPLY